MTTFGAHRCARVARSRRRDSEQARFLTVASLKWVIANKAYTPGTWSATTAWRSSNSPTRTSSPAAWSSSARTSKSTPRRACPAWIGKWVHIARRPRCAATRVRCGSGTRSSSARTTSSTPTSTSRSARPPSSPTVLHLRLRPPHGRRRRADQDQGIVKGPVRIGPDTWIAAKVTVLRNTRVGRGCVLGAHAVVKGDIPTQHRRGLAREGGEEPYGRLGGRAADRAKYIAALIGHRAQELASNGADAAPAVNGNGAAVRPDRSVNGRPLPTGQRTLRNLRARQRMPHPSASRRRTPARSPRPPCASRSRR